MAIGITPKHVEDFEFNGFTQQQFLVLANEVAVKLGWNVSYISDRGFIAYTQNTSGHWNSEVKIKIENGVANIKSASTSDEMMDWGKNKKTVDSFLSNFEEVKRTSTKEELNAKYEELKEKLGPEEDILQLPPVTVMEHILVIFKPTQGFFVTPIIINLNLLVFILMAINGVSLFSPDSESLLKWGANFRPMTLDGEWWRLITCCFLHIGFFHLLMNMYALFCISISLEPILGKARFASAYLLTGVTASVASLWWYDLTISAGASGAVFGMYGVFLAMLTTNLIEKAERTSQLTSIVIFVGYNLIYGLKGGIDNAAHIGGLVCGVVIGYAFMPSLKTPDRNKFKYRTIGLLSSIIFGLSFFAYNNISSDIVTYDKRMSEFASMELKALEVYTSIEDVPTDKALSIIKEEGLYHWNENMKILGGLEGLDLPLVLKNRIRLLKEYCDLRIKSYELLYNTISENTDQYNAQLNEYYTQIQAKVDELGRAK